MAFEAFAFTTIANFSVDTSKSKVVWTASKVTGTHTGTVKVKSGNLQLDGGKLVGGSFFDGLGDKTIYDAFDLQVTLASKGVTTHCWATRIWAKG